MRSVIVEIVNNCEQCGQKFSVFSIDGSSNKGFDMGAEVAKCIEIQKKEVIEPAHKGHKYKLKVNTRG